jgi:hypothetical protein
MHLQWKGLLNKRFIYKTTLTKYNITIKQQNKRKGKGKQHNPNINI